MKDLETYFENAFSDPKIALNRKKDFGDDHIERMHVQNTDGSLDDRIAATENVQNALFGGITDLSTDRSQRQARTKTTDSVIVDFKARNSRLNSYFMSNGIDKLDVYTEFFPQGVQDFTSRVTKENVEQRIQSLVTAITNNLEVAGGQAVLNEYNAFKTGYKQAREAQLAKTGQVSTGEDVLGEIEAAWDDQVFDNLLFFANKNRNKPENLKLYMDQSLLEHDTHHNTTQTGKIKGTITDDAGHPLKNVVVHILDGKLDNAHSDVNGNYLTHPLPIGNWQIDYTKGDKKVSRNVEINEGEVLQLNVVLENGKA